MKFTGQIRIPDLDHPGVPATFVIEGAQAEVILEGDESLGRWSLFDVRARRLVSAAFQVELDGEEVTFIADEPMDFAYKGVEQMAEVWARFKTMNVVRRAVSVSRSRRGSLPSRVPELRAAMEKNLGVAQPSSGLAGAVSAPPKPFATRPEEQARAPETEQPSAAQDPEPSIPVVSAPTRTTGVDVPSEEAVVPAAASEEAKRLEAERNAIEEERERLEEQRRALIALKEEAERREADRVEAFRLEMQRLEEERREYERLHQDRQTSMHEAMEQLEVERGEMEKRGAEQDQREEEDFARAAALRERMEEIEEERVRREQEESERVAAAQSEMEQLEEQRRRIESLEKTQDEERVAPRPEEVDRPPAKHVAPSDVAPIDPPDQEHVPGETSAAEDEPEERIPEEAVSAGTNGAGTVVDLGELETETPDDDDDDDAAPPDDGATSPDEAHRPEPAGGPDPDREPEPAMAGASRQSGIMGAVRAAFGRGGKEHVHEFVDAPGGIGIVRSICRECGYVSITTED